MPWLYRYWAFVTAAMVPPVLVVLLLVPGSADPLSRLAWAHPLVYFVHQVEEHAWPGGFKNFINRHVFQVTDRDLPLDDRAVFWINVPLTWVTFPLAALWLKEFPLLAAGCFCLSLVNGIVHTIGGIRERAWNPGLITGVTLLIPVGWSGYGQMSPALQGGELAGVWAIGIGVHVLIVAYSLLMMRRAR